MKKLVIFMACLLAALTVDFLREGMFARVHAQLQKTVPVPPVAPPASGGYPAPGPALKPAADAASGKSDPAAGPYPAPVSRPVEKKNAGDK
ncbi:MAG: hypothetical protein MUF69_13230 [Desulfobacterota bacterium]|jgi:hypothetical protein|nr:hypothetical protein [Thermodesulfobacteriota bacterium]